MQPQPKKRRWDMAAAPAPQQAPATTNVPQAAPPAGVNAILAQATVLPPGSTQAQPPRPGQPSTAGKLDPETLRRVQENAKAIAAKLAAKKGGKPLPPNHPVLDPAHQPPSSSQDPSSSSSKAPSSTAEVILNNAPAHKRMQLTKKTLLATIEARWKVIIVVKGMYYPPGGGPTEEALASGDDGDKPLFLRITPGTGIKPPTKEAEQWACGGAAAEILSIITNTSLPLQYQQHYNAHHPPAPHPGMGLNPHYPQHAQQPQPQYPPLHYNAVWPPSALAGPPPAPRPPPPGSFPYPPRQQQEQPQQQQQPQGPVYPTEGPGFKCLYFGVLDPPAEFDAAGKIRGPNSSYLGHIATVTGTLCEVRGKGAGPGLDWGPLHVKVGHQDPETLQKAVELAMSLIDTIRDDYKAAYPKLPPPPPKGQYNPPALPALPSLPAMPLGTRPQSPPPAGPPLGPPNQQGYNRVPPSYGPPHLAPNGPGTQGVGGIPAQHAQKQQVQGERPKRRFTETGPSAEPDEAVGQQARNPYAMYQQLQNRPRSAGSH